MAHMSLNWIVNLIIGRATPFFSLLCHAFHFLFLFQTMTRSEFKIQEQTNNDEWTVKVKDEMSWLS